MNMATWMMYSFQDPNSPFADNLYYFYNFTMIILIIITASTMYMLTFILMNNFMNLNLLKNHNIEILWTITPMIMLLIISIPSLKTLYFIDELWNPSYFTIKSIGHQWYWSYEYPEFHNIMFDSYMIKSIDNLNQFRLLDVDNRTIIPYKIPIRLLVSSMDVIHSWTVPSLGIKMDASPGRINQMSLISLRPGIFFGQCSEICGAYHSFMPIMIESTNYSNFINWVNKME